MLEKEKSEREGKHNSGGQSGAGQKEKYTGEVRAKERETNRETRGRKSEKQRRNRR